MERLPLEFDSFFSEEQPAPDGEGLFRCACVPCKSFFKARIGEVSSIDVGCLVRVIVPGDVCDACISDCYHGCRDISISSIIA